MKMEPIQINKNCHVSKEGRAKTLFIRDIQKLANHTKNYDDKEIDILLKAKDKLIESVKQNISCYEENIAMYEIIFMLDDGSKIVAFFNSRWVFISIKKSSVVLLLKNLLNALIDSKKNKISSNLISELVMFIQIVSQFLKNYLSV